MATANPKKEVRPVMASGVKRFQAWFDGKCIGEFNTAHQAEGALNKKAIEWIEANR